jgi:hypothetical protein
MRYSSITVFILLVVLLSPLSASQKKIRLAGTAGGVLHNDLARAPGFTGGGGAAIAYPVSAKDGPVNVELAIANWYNFFPSDADLMQTLRFGFGVRIFINVFKSLRPYFTHDICSHIVWVSDRSNYASTLGILLGLGVDVPLGSTNPSQEASSLFFDVSYNTFSLANFSASPEEARFISASFGYSLLLPKRKNGK